MVDATVSTELEDDIPLFDIDDFQSAICDSVPKKCRVKTMNKMSLKSILWMPPYQPSFRKILDQGRWCGHWSYFTSKYYVKFQKLFGRSPEN